MTGRAVLGDFLAAAHRDLEAAAAPSRMPVPGRDAGEIIASFRRLTTVLGGYVTDLTTSLAELPDRDAKLMSAYARAAAEVGDALADATAVLSISDRCARPVSRQARRLDVAAASLVAGRDLLQAHFASELGGRRSGRSGWAPVIAFPPVSRALVAEIVAMSRRAAVVGDGAVAAGRPWPAAQLGRRLDQACRWLTVAGVSAESVYEHEPVSDAERDLLHAIPGSALPPRRAATSSERVPGWCAAVITTSERASHLAWVAAGVAAGSPDISVTSWRQIASASSATSHHCYLLLTALGERAGQHPGKVAAIRDPRSAIRDPLERAAGSTACSSRVVLQVDSTSSFAARSRLPGRRNGRA